MMSSEEALETALAARETVRIARQIEITHGCAFMTYCCALANSEALPPFMPLGRNTDGLFGVMLEVCDSTSFSAQLPHGVIHDSGRSPSYLPGFVASASETRMADVLIELTHAWATPGVGRPGDMPLTGVGRRLLDFAALAPDDFLESFVSAVVELRRPELEEANRVQSEIVEPPSHWRDAVLAYSSTCVSHMTTPEWYLPVEFKDAAGLHNGFAALQSLVRNFGDLLNAWPHLWSASHRLMQTGFADDF
jgi:hypothetical protein